MSTSKARLVLAAAVMAAHATADPVTFDFKDPKQVNSIAFILDSSLEPIMGIADGISGTVSYDPAYPEKASGKIVVDAKSLKTPNEKMNSVLHSADWLDVERHKTIDFEFMAGGGKKNTKSKDGVARWIAKGKLTCHGKSIDIAVPVTATYLKDRAKDRMRGAEGDLLVLRAEFRINRKDFGIKPSYGPEVVAEQIELRVSIVGMQTK